MKTKAEQLRDDVAEIARLALCATELAHELERENADLRKQVAHLMARPAAVECHEIFCKSRPGGSFAPPQTPQTPQTPPKCSPSSPS